MFRFWTSESRGCDKTTDATEQGFLPTAHDYFGTVHNAYDAPGASAAAAAVAPGLAGSAGPQRRQQPSQPFKRKRSAADRDDAAAALNMPPSPSTEMDPPAEDPLLYHPPAKRIKTEAPDQDAAWPQAAYGAAPYAGDKHGGAADRLASPPSPPPSVSLAAHDGSALETVQDVVQYQFGLEILMKHNELRLIEQELAKCQIALEQLRRCHLIPYPTACPTPEQMLDIASGRGTAVRPRPGAAVPKWSSPFGVVDGPYARHYAKWLIPDPVFDGPLPNWPGFAPPARSKSAATADARATRNSHGHLADAAGKGGRPTRGLTGQKLHALSNGYPQPKDRAGPCVLKRCADGKVVKLVCIDCHRDNFSSTQGFINHCRIAHKRDFKSHEEAAVHCGHPIEVDHPVPQTAAAKAAGATPLAGAAAAATASCPPASASPAVAADVSAVFASPAVSVGSTAPSAVPGHVHTLARGDSEAVNTLLQQIGTSYKQYARSQAKRETAPSSTTSTTSTLATTFTGSDKTPFLSRFLEKKRFAGNLDASVEDAKEVTDLTEASWFPDDSFEDDCETPPSAGATPPPPASSTVKRAPARPAQQQLAPLAPVSAGGFDGASGDADADGTARPGSGKKSSKNTALRSLGGGEASVTSPTLYVDDEMDVDLSPIPSASNNAPSLVSDDGEYDDSDDEGSDSGTSDTELGSVSDVAEINVDEDEDQTHAPRPLRHHRGSVKLKKDESKHVTFVSPVKGAKTSGRT